MNNKLFFLWKRCVPLFFIFFLAVSCEKDSSSLSVETPLGIESAREFYSKTHAGFNMPEFMSTVVLKSRDSIPERKLMWEFATTDQNGRAFFVEVPILGGPQYAYYAQSEDADTIPSADRFVMNTFSKLIVKQDKKTGEKSAFIITIVADREYYDKCEGNILNFKYLRREGFSGRIYKSEIDGTVVWAKYTDDGLRYKQLILQHEDGETFGYVGTKGMWTDICSGYVLYEWVEYCYVTVIMDSGGDVRCIKYHDCFSRYEQTQIIHFEILGCEWGYAPDPEEDTDDPPPGIPPGLGGETSTEKPSLDRRSVIAPNASRLFRGNSTLTEAGWIILEKLVTDIQKTDCGKRLFALINDITLNLVLDTDPSSPNMYNAINQTVYLNALYADVDVMSTLYHELFHAFQTKQDPIFYDHKMNVEVEAHYADYYFSQSLLGLPPHPLALDFQSLEQFMNGNFGVIDEADYNRVYQQIVDRLRASGYKSETYPDSPEHRTFPNMQPVYRPDNY